MKEKFIKEVLKIKGSHTFKTEKKDLIGFWFEGVEGEALSIILKDFGIDASTESPCIKKFRKSLGITRMQAHSSIVIRWKKGYKKEDIKKILSAIKFGVKKLRQISGWRK